MVLKHRLLLSFYSAASTAALAAVAAFYLFVTPAYFDIEEDAVRNEVVRVETAFMQSLNTLYLRSRDWAERAQVQALVAGDTQAQPLPRSEEHTSELQSRPHLVCRLLLEKKK